MTCVLLSYNANVEKLYSVGTIVFLENPPRHKANPIHVERYILLGRDIIIMQNVSVIGETIINVFWKHTPA